MIEHLLLTNMSSDPEFIHLLFGLVCYGVVFCILANLINKNYN